ncbi:Imidazoleglycerol-phosphate dehydratase [Dirofilaria immitis]
MQKSKRMIQKLQNFPPLSLQGDLSNEDSDTRNNVIKFKMPVEFLQSKFLYVSFVVQNASPIKLPKIDGVETATEEIGAKYVKLDQAWYCTEFDDYIGGVWNCELSPTVTNINHCTKISRICILSSTLDVYYAVSCIHQGESKMEEKFSTNGIFQHSISYQHLLREGFAANAQLAVMTALIRGKESVNYRTLSRPIHHT